MIGILGFDVQLVEKENPNLVVFFDAVTNSAM